MLTIAAFIAEPTFAAVLAPESVETFAAVLENAVRPVHSRVVLELISVVAVHEWFFVRLNRSTDTFAREATGVFVAGRDGAADSWGLGNVQRAPRQHRYGVNIALEKTQGRKEEDWEGRDDEERCMSRHHRCLKSYAAHAEWTVKV